MSERMIVTTVVVILAMVGLFVVCDAVFDDEDEPGDLGLAPAYVMDRDERNRNGNDCHRSQGHCEDNDQVMIAPVICVEPGSCRFG